jgi:hypothetical protein
MFTRPTLGGFSAKYAGAYLLPPADKLKKKKKPQSSEDVVDELAKTAAAQDAVREQQAVMRRQLRANDLGGGWNPYNQIQSDN